MKTTIRWWPDGAQGAPAVFEVLEDDGGTDGYRLVKSAAAQVLAYAEAVDAKARGAFERPIFGAVKKDKDEIQEDVYSLRVTLGLPRRWTKAALLADLKKQQKEAA